MRDSKTIRLSKVLREFNISLDRAVEFLSSKGYSVEAKPSAKISKQEYLILFNEFSWDRNMKSSSKKVLDSQKMTKEQARLSQESEQDSSRDQKTKFIAWMAGKENKKEMTLDNYSRAIDYLSRHYSKHVSKEINFYQLHDLSERQWGKYVRMYDKFGEFSDFGAIGNRTNINALKALVRFKLNRPKEPSSTSYSQSKKTTNPTVQKNHTQNSIQEDSPRLKKSKGKELSWIDEVEFSNQLRNEAEMMSKHYQNFYCLERTMRDFVSSTMKEQFGSSWWSRVNDRVQENVENNRKYEMDSTHTKRSDNNIDYTTFGDLRIIITKDHWSTFSNKFSKSSKAINEIMIDLNKLRVSIAHITPLSIKEQVRLNLRISDLFDAMKKS